MSTSGSFDFTLTTSDAVKGALQVCEVLGEGEDASSDQISDAKIFFNSMIKAWQADGLHLWAIKSTAFNMTAGTALYTFGSGQDVNIPKPLRVIECTIEATSSSQETTLTKISREEYWSQSDKTTTGIPNQYYFDPKRVHSEMYLWPTPSSTAASDYQINVSLLYPFDDMDSNTDEVAFPQEWYQALIFGLAERLAFQYGVPRFKRRDIIMQAARYKDQVEDFDREDASLFLSPSWRR